LSFVSVDKFRYLFGPVEELPWSLSFQSVNRDIFHIMRVFPEVRVSITISIPSATAVERSAIETFSFAST